MRKIDRLSYLPDHIVYHILFLMDNKYAVSTCVLSKNWRYSWTHIHSLNFCLRSFLNSITFHGFVTRVLHHRKDLNLVKLKFYCSDGELDSIDAIIETLTSIVFEYAISHRFEELETDIVDNFPATLFECQTLKTLKLGQTTKCLRDLSGFATLTTLQLSSVIIDLENDTFFGCLNLENLLLIECTLLADPVQVVMGVYTISAPRLVNLQISDFLYHRTLVINGPRLKFFNLNGTYPLLLSMEKCPALEKVNIHMSPSIDNSLKQEYVQRMILMGKEVCHVKSLTLFVHLSKGKFILYHDTVDAETKIVEFNKETGEEQLLFALPMVQDFEVHLLAYIIPEMASKKCSILSSETGRTWLSGFGMIGAFALKNRVPPLLPKT
ncbi:hypothetical protein LWI29_006655 [Acer saccharum]|uniref:F-box domain-containing protein n=1 Tax=Acer saccharum TaxID=4024 RepID=A0AA39SBU2_ACESA|nr:hypothetical protein LWI29_006655 [Acer saccharum]